MPSTRWASGTPLPAARASTTDVAARLSETGSFAATTSATKQPGRQQEQQRVGAWLTRHLNAFCSGSTAFEMRSTLSSGMLVPQSLVMKPSLSPSATATT